MKKPITRYIVAVGLNILVLTTIAGYICVFFNSEIYNIIVGAFINISMFPDFIWLISDGGEGLTIFGYVVTVFMSVVFILPYILTAVSMFKKGGNGANGVCIALLGIDIFFFFWIVILYPIAGIVNLVLKSLLIICCIRNIKWNEENYDKV